MTLIKRPTQFIQADIAHARQSVNATFIFERWPAKVRIKIQSDSYDFQSFARVEFFSPTDLKWTVVGHIPYSEMKTPHKLAYTANGVSKANFQADFDKLLGITDRLLGPAPEPVSGPAVVLVFADVPEGQPVESCLIGPMFFKNKRAALQRFAEYFVLRIRDNENLSESLAICLGLNEDDDYAGTDEELLMLLGTGQENHLQILCDDYVSYQVLVGSQAFYCIEAVPGTLD